MPTLDAGPPRLAVVALTLRRPLLLLGVRPTGFFAGLVPGSKDVAAASQRTKTATELHPLTVRKQ